MKCALLLLLATLSAATCAQASDRGQSAWNNDRFSPQHQREKQEEQRAIALRVKNLLRASTDRNETRYAENRRRCQAALRVAELCGKFAGAFYCDDRGFRPVVADAAARPVVMGNAARHKMEHCVLDAARRDP